MKMPNDEKTAREWILAARENDPKALLDCIIALYDCQPGDVNVDEEGDIWINTQENGFWLDDDEGLFHGA